MSAPVRCSSALGDETSPLPLALGLGDAGQELAAAASAERAMDRLDVLMHRVWGEVQIISELFLTGPGHQLGEDLPLTRGQARASALDAIPIVPKLFVQELDE